MATEPEIIYKDQEAMVISKPAGWLTAGQSNHWPSVEEWLKRNVKSSNLLERAGIVHRLDRETTGGLLVALNSQALEYYREQFKKRTVEKYYWALVSGRATSWGRVEMPIGVWHRQGVVKRKVKIVGKMAKTEFWRLALGKKEGLDYSWLKVRIYTGRTHQIRVHLAYLGWPIVGDRWYGRTKEKRLMLHAGFLAFNNPRGQRVEVEIPIPIDMIKINEEYGL